jgi:YD repeat-containing protein
MQPAGRIPRHDRCPAPDATAWQLFKDSSAVRDLRYSYDPVGNITRIEDAALKAIIRAGQNVKPVGAYTYDAVYRLNSAAGRQSLRLRDRRYSRNPHKHLIIGCRYRLRFATL